MQVYGVCEGIYEGIYEGVTDGVSVVFAGNTGTQRV